MLKIAVVINYTPNIIYIIKKNNFKLVIMAFNKTINPMFSNILIYEFRN